MKDKNARAKTSGLALFMLSSLLKLAFHRSPAPQRRSRRFAAVFICFSSQTIPLKARRSQAKSEISLRGVLMLALMVGVGAAGDFSVLLELEGRFTLLLQSFYLGVTTPSRLLLILSATDMEIP
jgi:hypothetical protein